jgi:hypothetical protein
MASNDNDDNNNDDEASQHEEASHNGSDNDNEPESSHSESSSEQEKVQDDMDEEALSTPVGQRTVPQDPGKPLLSTASSSSSQASASSSSSSMDSEAYYLFTIVWYRLKKGGWRHVSAPKPFRELDPKWYVRPDFNLNNQTKQDYQHSLFQECSGRCRLGQANVSTGS